ncbi:DUF2794 domain-containing protein [Acuticoccus sp. MNP-M23]|uniref:DUF2794 domain-containing protein n=1 Tax=Acuticoccus sp. MNP-M23 TaxID=3072793 RepID=UPI0028166224|nr:DUF2794 domain-containing protein [Acuticoccus sp. MNP-M23]WMS43077.1 DUF2794 domain-containing protein [Acuticoccus sp. MNP-M23]
MAEGEEASRIVPLRPKSAASQQAPAANRPPPPLVAFQRIELGQILRVYGRMVAAGEWRDYALDHGREQAVFSIYRQMGEVPMYRVTKTPKLARKQGAYAVVSAQGMVLKRGHDLDAVLRVFEKKRHLSVVGD